MITNVKSANDLDNTLYLLLASTTSSAAIAIISTIIPHWKMEV